MTEQAPHPQDLSTEQAAELMAVHSRSVLRWVKAGLLPAYQTGGGRWRIHRSSLAHFMAERGMAVPTVLTAGPARIALVDDDERFVAALVETLAELAPGADVRVAHDGFAAGLLLATFRPDLLLLDLVMPGLDGFEVLRRLRTHPDLDQTAVVVISGALNPDARKRFEDLGADRCLAKPINADELDRALTECLGGSARSDQGAPTADQARRRRGDAP